MATLSTECHSSHPTQHWLLGAVLLLLLLLGACGGDADDTQQQATVDPLGTVEVTRRAATDEPAEPRVDLLLAPEDVSVDPLPLRAGFPFTMTAVVHNRAEIPAVDVPVMFYISARHEELGYTSFLHLITVTVPASQSLPIEVPVDWNFTGGEHQLWVQVNRLPDAWQDRLLLQPEENTGDNIALLDLMVDPFDAYISDLCSGRTDVEIGPTDILPEPDRQRVMVRVHNVGNRAVYNLPVVITGEELTGIAYTPAIPPCGGITNLYVEVDRPFQEGETLVVQVNPGDWADGLQEDNEGNNQVAVTAGLAPGMDIPSGAGVTEYDFSISSGDIEIPEMWHVLVTVHNLGTRDAADVPIRIENEAGRKISDVIPLVQGEGMGVAAIRVGYLWTPGGTLTFTLNPEDADGAYPETNRENNLATFTLP